MKKIVIALSCCFFCLYSLSQDSMNKKMENKTDKMNRKTIDPNDPMNKKIGNTPDTIRGGRRMPLKSDSLRRKKTPKVPGR